MTHQERVTHKETGLEGAVLGGRALSAGAPDYAGDLAGRWLEVLWDDGSRFSVPLNSIRFELPPLTSGGR